MLSAFAEDIDNDGHNEVLLGCKDAENSGGNGEGSVQVFDPWNFAGVSMTQTNITVLPETGSYAPCKVAGWKDCLDSSLCADYTACVNDIVANHCGSPASGNCTLNLTLTGYNGSLKLYPLIEYTGFWWNVSSSAPTSMVDSINYFINVTPFESAAHANATFTQRNFTIDHTPPSSIVLNKWANNSGIGTTHFLYTDFNWTATDNLGGNVTCNVSVRKEGTSWNPKKNLPCTSGTLCNTAVGDGETFYEEGRYNWTVDCSDSAGNKNVSQTWIFTIDVTAPAINQSNVTATDPSLRVINATSSVDVGNTITFRAIVSDSISSISAVWVKVWKTTKEAGILLWEGMMSLVNGMWSVSWVTNSSLTTGLANYTIYVNDTANNTFTFDSNFSVNYKPTQGTPVVTSGFYNTTYGNLTCSNTSTADADGDAVVNVFDWRRNITGSLLPDSDMEAADTSAWSFVGTGSKEITSPHGGLRNTKVVTTTTYSVLYQPATLTAGKTYRFTGWARGDGGAGYPALYDAGGAPVLWQGTTSTAWQRFDFVYTARYTSMYFMNPTTGYVEWDDIKQEEIKSDAVLNMPFEADRNATQAKDYSNYGNNGTLGSGANMPRWNASCGAFTGSGGCYEFNGLDKYIETSYRRTDYKFTYSTWYMPAGVQPGTYNYGCLFGAATASSGMTWRIVYANGANAAFIQFYNSTPAANNVFYTGAAYGNWQHIAVTYDNSTQNVTIYTNGAYATSSIIPGGMYETTSDISRIGNCQGTTFDFNGTIDEVKIWNRTISATEIASLYANSRNNVIEKSALKYGDSWVCAVTPNDGIADREMKNATRVIS